jgi:hypothetical protein
MPVLTFDEFGADQPAPVKGGALTFDEFAPKSTAKDVALSAISGLDKGVAGLAGLPADAALGINYLVNLGKSKVQGRPFDEVEAESDRNAVISRDAVRAYGSQAAHANSPLRHDPETTAGKYAQTGAEFIPGALLGPGNMAKNAAIYGVAPGLASEAAGQATEGTPYEPYARGAAGIAAGVTGHWATSPNAAQSAVGRAAQGTTAAQVDQAEQLFQSAQQMGVPITRAEALQHVTGGATNLGNLQRVVEGSGELGPVMAQRPGQVQAAVRTGLENVSERAPNPSLVGPSVNQTARQVMGETPEGQILDEAVWRAGPRTTPEQAGNIIQQDLRNVYDRREGMRGALADQDYTAARQAGVPVSTDNVVGFIDRELETAKGSTATALQSARKTMFKPDGSIDESVAGLHNARGAISDLIEEAKRTGANNTARELGGTLDRLDSALEQVPAYGQARKNFAAASKPLDVFGESRVPGQAIERDQFNQRFVMPPEKIPAAIENNSPSAARDFNSVASPRAKEAFEQNIVTQVLDDASKQGADISSNSIRQALKQHEDLLKQYPGVRDRLENVAIAREGLAKIEQLPIGRLAAKDITTKQAVEALFPANPLSNSEEEISQAVGALSAKNPGAARQLVRTHIEGVFNEASQRLQSGANQFGGAGFAAVLRGNPQQSANLEAAIKALPNGTQTYEGFDKLMTILEAQGSRQRIGSQTAFNQEVQQGLKQGGSVAEALTGLATGGIKLPSKVTQRIEQWRMGGNVKQIADILTNPEAGPLFRQLATAPPNSSRALALVARMTYLGSR